jgi:hypothetical protein
MKQTPCSRSARITAVLLVFGAVPIYAQQSLTWEQAKAQFQASNAALKAAADNVDEISTVARP